MLLLQTLCFVCAMHTIAQAGTPHRLDSILHALTQLFTPWVLPAVLLLLTDVPAAVSGLSVCWRTQIALQLT